MRGHGSKVLLSAGLLAGMTGLAGGVAPAAHAVGGPGTARTGGPLLPTPHEVLPVHGGTATSLNWSGYAVTSSAKDITGVATQFKVPSAALLPPGFAATWAGIGGYSSSDLIQAGVGENSLVANPLTGPQYYAWYELLPASETPIANCSGDTSCTVSPGDDVTVSIVESAKGSGSWSITMTDGSKWTWKSPPISYTSSQSSAEWILEAPTVLLQTTMAPVGTVHFGPADSYTDGTGTHTIAQGNPTRIVLSPGLVNEATPSALASDGASFNDCAYQQTCPAP